MEPAIEESIVTFHCPSQLVLNGPDLSTCNRNGEWEPDPRNLQCLGEYIISLMSFIMIFIGLDHTVDCHSPSPPPSGYILPYPSTLEGATLTYVCWSIQHGAGLCEEVNKTAVCNKRGQWEPSADIICTQPEGALSIPIAIMSCIVITYGESAVAHPCFRRGYLISPIFCVSECCIA